MVKRRFQLGAVSLDYRCDSDGEGLELEVTTSGGEQLRATVRLKAPALVRFAKVIVPKKRERRFAPWALDLTHVSFQTPGTDHADYMGREGDVFEGVVTTAQRAVAARDSAAWAAALEELGELQLLVAEAVQRAVDLCEREAFVLARRFHPLVRSYVYEQLVADGSGRVRQLAQVCPGVLVFAGGLHSRGGIAREAAGQLIRDVVAGRPLAGALREPALVFLLTEAAMLEHQHTAAEPGNALAILDGSAEVLDAWTNCMRLFVRRAGPRLSPIELCTMPPPQLTPEDIPRRVRPNARWYAAMRLATLVANDRGVPDGLWAFFSRHALAWHDLVRAAAEDPGEPWSVHVAGVSLVRDAVDYAEASGRWPTRSTNLEAWFTSMKTWRRDRDRLTDPAQRLGDHLEELRALGLGEVEAIRSLGDDHGWDGDAGPVFPALDVAGAQVSGVELRPIRTALELAAEGQRMGHCVATLCGQLVLGGRWILSGEILGEPVTVEMSRTGERYEVEQARGAENRKLSESEWRALLNWVSAIPLEVPHG